MRPQVVWFGEMPFEMERIQDALSRCGLFLSIGTSGNVYPAAGFVQEARYAGARTVERSEEHTSELQSLMRISYAVFCLQKKTTNTTKLQPSHPLTQPLYTLQ